MNFIKNCFMAEKLMLSQNLVIIRMSDALDDALVPYAFQDALWEVLNKLIIR